MANTSTALFIYIINYMRTRAYDIIACKGTIFSVKEMSETCTFFAKLNFFNYIVPNAMFSALRWVIMPWCLDFSPLGNTFGTAA